MRMRSSSRSRTPLRRSKAIQACETGRCLASTKNPPPAKVACGACNSKSKGPPGCSARNAWPLGRQTLTSSGSSRRSWPNQAQPMTPMQAFASWAPWGHRAGERCFRCGDERACGRQRRRRRLYRRACASVVIAVNLASGRPAARRCAPPEPSSISNRRCSRPGGTSRPCLRRSPARDQNGWGIRCPTGVGAVEAFHAATVGSGRTRLRERG